MFMLISFLLFYYSLDFVFFFYYFPKNKGNDKKINMSIKIGINGLGRIGRMVIRSLVENKNKNIVKNTKMN